MIEDKKTILKAVRMRLKRICLMFLLLATLNPLVLSAMVFILYKLEAEELKIVLIIFAFIIPSQIVIGLFFYKRYKKISDLDDYYLAKTKFYLNIEADIYVKNYVYDGHIIQIANGLDATSLIVDGTEVKKVSGPRVRNYKMKFNLNDNMITAIYKQGYKGGDFSLFFNQIKLNEQIIEENNDD